MAFYSPYYTVPTTPIVSPTSWLFTPSPTPAYTRTPTYYPAAAYSPAAINYRHKHTPVWPTTSPLAVPAWPYLSPAAPAQPVAQPYAQPYSVYATGTPLVHMTPMAPYSPYFTYTPGPRPIHPESPTQHHFHHRRRRQSRTREHDQDQERSNRRNRTHRERAWAWDRDGRGPAAEATPATPRRRPAVQRYPNLLPHPPRFIRPRYVPPVPHSAGNIQINPILRSNPVNPSEPVLEWDIRAPIQTARVFPLKTSPPTSSSPFHKIFRCLQNKDRQGGVPVNLAEQAIFLASLHLDEQPIRIETNHHNNPLFQYLWGPLQIHVSPLVTIGNVLEAIRRHFMQPVDDELERDLRGQGWSTNLHVDRHQVGKWRRSRERKFTGALEPEKTRRIDLMGKDTRFVGLDVRDEGNGLWCLVLRVAESR